MISGSFSMLKFARAVVYRSSEHGPSPPALRSPSKTEKATWLALMSASRLGYCARPSALYGISPKSPIVYFSPPRCPGSSFALDTLMIPITKTAATQVAINMRCLADAFRFMCGPPTRMLIECDDGGATTLQRDRNRTHLHTIDAKALHGRRHGDVLASGHPDERLE